MKFYGLWLMLLLWEVNLKLAVCFKCNFVVDSWYGYTCIIAQGSVIMTEKHIDEKTDDDVIIYKFEGNNNTHLTQRGLSPVCQRFKKLDRVELHYIKSVNENLFQQCRDLSEINIMNSEVKEIPENLFSYQSNLTEIHLVNNKLETLPENVFSNQKELKILLLYQNQISYLPPNIFMSLTKLTVLNLNNNNIQSLNSKWFETLRSLKWLFLDDNKIQDLQKNAFVYLQNLQRLYLNDNQLTTIHSDSFGVNNNLWLIHFQNNKINAVDEKLIDNVMVNEIYMSGNVCSKKWIGEKRNEIKAKLSNCTINYRSRDESIFKLPDVSNFHCGKYQTGMSLIFNGIETERNDFPWNAALIHISGGFFCGGTLVSNKHIVTAAHCMNDKRNTHNYTIDDFTVLLGVYNLSDYQEEGRVQVSVKAINIHPDWNVFVNLYDADIAVLELATEVNFNEFITPICVPDVDSQVAKANKGTAVGFGKTESGTISDVAKILEIPIYDYKNCTKYSRAHRSLVSSKGFCGGPADGRGVCSGDSGSGVYVIHEMVYYLRGLVSSSLANAVRQCDVQRKAIFTDVPKFYGWIKSGGLDEHAKNRKKNI